MDKDSLGEGPDPDSAIDEGKVLRVVATYTDSLGDERMSRAVSDIPGTGRGLFGPRRGFQPCQRLPRLFIPERLHQDRFGEPWQGYERRCAAVEATDPNLDRLTYELDDNVTVGDTDTAIPEMAMMLPTSP